MGTANRRTQNMEENAKKRRRRFKQMRQEGEAKIRKAATQLMPGPVVANICGVGKMFWHPAMRGSDAVVKPRRHDFVPVAEM